MLTFGVLNVQYFLVGLFDFYRATAPANYWILDSLQASISSSKGLGLTQVIFAEVALLFEDKLAEG